MRSRAVRRPISVATLALALLTLLAPAASAGDPGDGELQAAAVVTEERLATGRPALRLCADLSKVAERWSRHMARTRSLSHNPDVSEQIGEWTRWAENVAYGSSVRAASTALLRSAGHRDNILSDELTEVGVGVVRSRGRVWVTQVFRTPAGPPCPA